MSKKAPTTLININGDVREASSLNVPADRAFRGAWQFEGEAVSVDMDKAREIQKDVIRQERAPELASLDIQTMKALEAGGDVAPIAAQKQKLRAVTDDARIAAASTPDELRALTLESLSAN